MSLSLKAIQHAAWTLRRRLPISPLLEVGDWRLANGIPMLIKAECLMPTGSFKIRGATLKIASLSEADRARGVIAYSTGNHAQAVAKAAADAHISAVVVMSPDVPAAKIEATRAYGAAVLLAESSSQARRELAEQVAAERGLVLVPPYDDYTIMEGQASIAVELFEQMRPRIPSAVFVPVGGGGLLAGMAAAIKQVAPEVRVIGVEPVLEQDACQSFHSGQLVAMRTPSRSIADAIKVQSLGQLTFPLIRRFVDEFVVVSEAEIADACLRYFSEARLVVEPGGAVALAAAFKYQETMRPDMPAVVIAAGGNITVERLSQLKFSADNIARRA